ncbi:MAG: hypothetical protein CME64_05395 [Halobacteriovoraceae bacterium]|nr:hypothetical protein [Halobacteriovoraceae bacterium]|tara:strand:- start:261545 stop:264394 length:2850 start_codon:yes stop_codon:yes gene_type:complete
MAKILVLLALNLFLAPVGYGKTKGPEKVTRWEYLLKLIEEEEKTINMVKRKTDHLLYRQFELLTEKIKLYKEKDNQRFLDLSTKGQKISRKKAFKRTLKRYEKARKFGLNILKRYPRTRYKAAIYHTLALNSRDYAYDKRELGYLRNAIKLSRKKSEVWYLSMTSLAEYYYNNKKYKKAVSIYSRVIHNKSDEWHTKNLYNYGWCLLKTHKFEQAISRLEEGYKLSLDKKYIDFREQIMQSLVSFYVIGKQIDRGIAFVMKHDKSPYEALTRFARKTSEKGFYKETEQLIKLAEDNFDSKKKDEQLADLRLFQFDFYNQYKRDTPLFKIAKDLTQIKLNDYQRDEAVRKISDKSRVEQMILKKDFDKVASSYNVKRLSKLESYFDFLAILDKKNDAMYRFFTAETLYSVHEFKRALKSYKRALETQLKTPSKMDLNRKAVDGIFSSIDFAKFPKEREKDELIYAYSNFLQLWPKDPKSPKVHQKLFAIYLSRSDHKNIELSLNNYIKGFPKEKEMHRKLFKQWMDLSIALKKPYLLARLVNEMQKGKLGFPKEEIKKAEVILATLLFGKFQKMNEKGDTEDAIAGYKKIFYDIHFPQSVKAESGFNIGILYIDLSESAKSVKWFKKAFPLFTEKEQDKKRVFLEKMSKRSALLQDFLNAAHIQRLVLDNFCHTKKKNISNLQQSISFDLANDYVLRALHTFKTYRKCVSDTSSIETAIITHLFRNSHVDELFSFVNSYKLAPKHKTLLSGYYERIFWKRFESRADRKSIARQMARLKDKELIDIVIGVSKYLTLSNQMDDLLESPIEIGEVFEPQKFNEQLSSRIASFVKIVEGQTKLLEIGNPQLSLFVYDELAESLFTLSNEISNYSPTSAPKELKTEFSKQMKIVAKTFLDQAHANIDASESFMYKYELLSPNARDIVSGNEALDSVNLRMPAKIMANTFDLEEKR